MKFSCEKALLQSAIAVTSRAVAQKSSIPALEGLLLHADSRLTISGYNLQTGIRTKVSADVTEPGEIVLNARLFGDIIRRMPDDVVVFTADDKQLVHLSCGDADFDILGLSAADYPELPMVEDDFSVSIQQKLLRAMIEETAFAVSTNESRPIHTGALFEIFLFQPSPAFPNDKASHHPLVLTHHKMQILFSNDFVHTRTDCPQTQMEPYIEKQFLYMIRQLG